VIRLLIVGEICLYREGLALLLRPERDIEVVGTAESVDGALDPVRHGGADIVLLDASMTDSVSAVRALVEANSAVRVVVLSIPESEHEVVAFAEAGVAGFVTREADRGRFTETIHAVARGDTLCSPRITATLLRRVADLAGRSPHLPALSRLTVRELEIVDLLASGLSNKEIASRLRIEVPTVKNHVHHILEKLQLRRRSEVAAALRN
jgi:two-component system, NarL family, nitrate/nitrite response regulator NarL